MTNQSKLPVSVDTRTPAESRERTTKDAFPGVGLVVTDTTDKVPTAGLPPEGRSRRLKKNLLPVAA